MACAFAAAMAQVTEPNKTNQTYREERQRIICALAIYTDSRPF